jgi:hypothetical protein
MQQKIVGQQGACGAFEVQGRCAAFKVQDSRTQRAERTQRNSVSSFKFPGFRFKGSGSRVQVSGFRAAGRIRRRAGFGKGAEGIFFKFEIRNKSSNSNDKNSKQRL